MIEGNDNLKIDTCSWNYSSWAGLVYSAGKRTAADYLAEYCKKYRTVEIDSWFYKIPARKEVESYKNNVDGDFRFTCKAPQKITQVFAYGTKEKNESFLSVDLYGEFLKSIELLSDQIAMVMFEFEYMNREKMASAKLFLESAGRFVKAIPRTIPIGIECRNGNYLDDEYFSFLKENDVSHVFSEKQYMPPVIDLIDRYRDKLNDRVIIRLLGGDRKEMETKTGEKWNRIVEEKDVKPIAGKILELLNSGKLVTVNVNNHYEGSAPLTIEKIMNEMH